MSVDVNQGIVKNTEIRNIPVDAYAQLSAECSIEGLKRSIIKVVWCQRDRFDLAFLLLLSFVQHGMYGTPQIKLPTKRSLQLYTLGLQTRAWNLNKKLLRANGRCKAAKKEFTRMPAGSYKFIRNNS